MLDTRDSGLAPPTTEAFVGVIALFMFMLLGIDMYRWIEGHHPPSFSVLYVPALVADLMRRALAPEGEKPTQPLSWTYVLVAYYSLIILISLVEWRVAAANPWFIVVTVLYLGIILFRAHIDRRKRADSREDA